jgi:hypothetical protein
MVWFKCFIQFFALIWNHMLKFVQVEKIKCDTLTPELRDDLQLLQKVTDRVTVALGVLESDQWSSGSMFIPYVFSVIHSMEKFADKAPLAVAKVTVKFDKFETKYSSEYQIFLLATFLDPSIPFEIGRTCTAEEFSAIREIMISKINAKIFPKTTIPGTNEPASDDFWSFPMPVEKDALPGETQFDM